MRNGAERLLGPVPFLVVSGTTVSLLIALVGAALLAGLLEAPFSRSSSLMLDARQEFPVTAMDREVGAANNSPAMLADPTEPRFVILANRLDAPDFGCALQVSGDGGRTWLPADPVSVLPSGAEKCYAPEIAFDRAGTLYYLFVGLHGPGNEPMGAFLTHSNDRGRTFSRPWPVLGPLNFSVRMAIDTDAGDVGRLHLLWLHSTSDPPLGGFGQPPNPILSAYSDDRGKTFSPPVQVNESGRQRVVAPALALGAEDEVHVAYYDLGADAVDYQGLEGPPWEGRWSLVLATSHDGGQRFEERVVDDAIVPPGRVMLIFTMPAPALASDGKRVCVAWADSRHGDPDALIRCSPNRGHGWLEAERLNDDELGNKAIQSLPSLSISPEGRVDAIFLDRRNDPKNFLNDVFYTYSADGGRHFSSNLQLTSDSFESRIGQQYANQSALGLVEFGSRISVLSEVERAVAAWTDTRNSGRFLTTAQDIFATRVDLSTPEADAVRRRWGGSLLVLGIVGIAVCASQYSNWWRGNNS